MEKEEKMTTTPISLEELMSYDEDDLIDMLEEEEDAATCENLEKALDIKDQICYQKMEIQHDIEAIRDVIRTEEDTRIRRRLRDELVRLKDELEAVEQNILTEYGIGLSDVDEGVVE